MDPRGLHEVECDCRKTMRLLEGCFDVLEPDAATWRHVMTLCERLHEEAGRAFHHATQHETLAKIKQLQPYGLQE